MISFKSSTKFDKNGLIILLDQDQIKSSKIDIKNKAVLESLTSLISTKQFAGTNGEFFPVVVASKVILFVGLGKKEELSSTNLRSIIKKAIQSSHFKSIKDIEIISHNTNDDTIRSIIEGCLIGGYSWKKYKKVDPNEVSVEDKNIAIIAEPKKIYQDFIEICSGVTLTRNLINENADTVTSDYLEETILKLIKGVKNTSVEILNRKEMKAKGLNLHLAVNQGSPREPKLIIVKYQGAGKNDPYTALIGKGITFDTGGLNLKPTGSMETMRTDMSGASAVIGTLKNTIALGIKKNVLFVVGIAENVIGSTAFKPGDVFRSYSGKTVEVLNTDAEGRLVLADAISYTVKNYKPTHLIDIATLTGACVVALGHDYAGLITTDDDLSRKLIHASNATDDRIWRLPSYPELKEAIKSQIADMKNLGFGKGAAGTLTAAEFLRQYVENTKWAHLDIAGTAFNEQCSRHYYSHGATGFGVRLLTHYLSNN